MRIKYSSQFATKAEYHLIKGNQKAISIGRDSKNDLALNSRFLDSTAVQLVRTSTQSSTPWQIHVLGIHGAEIGDAKLAQGETITWDGASPISVFPFVFQIQTTSESHSRESSDHHSDVTHQFLTSVHLEVLRQMRLGQNADKTPKTRDEVIVAENRILAAAAQLGLMHPDNESIINDLSGECVRDEMLRQIMDQENEKTQSLLHAESVWSSAVDVLEQRESQLQLLVAKVYNKLVSNHNKEGKVERVEKGFWPCWVQIQTKQPRALREYLAIRQIRKQIKDTLYGFGPLEDLLRMPAVTEIMVNASNEIFVEKNGRLQKSGRQFVSNDATMHVIKRIVARVGRRIDAAQPMVDARLPDGSRVNAIIPPLAVKGPCLTVRKFARDKLTMEVLVEKGSVTNQVVEFLEACVKARKSILVSGGTGTGKTTLLNILSQVVPASERIICIEDTHELQLDHPHVVFVECRDGNNEGKGKVSIRDLLKNSLRQRPDRLIVGECRGSEALDMLQAMNTGHDGSMTTIHANNPRESLERLEVLVKDSGLPSDAIRQQIVSAVDIIVQLKRESSGVRRVVAVSEVVGYDHSTQRIRLREIFQLAPDCENSDLELRGTGCIPSFASELIRNKFFQIQRFLDGMAVDRSPKQTSVTVAHEKLELQ